MLVLTRKKGETIFIGEDIRIVLVGIQGTQAQIGIDCPAALSVMRSELGIRTKKNRWPNMTPDEIACVVMKCEELKEWWLQPNAKDRKHERNDLVSFIEDLERWALSEYVERYAQWFKKE
jgi:carbon storage regulator CsrA